MSEEAYYICDVCKKKIREKSEPPIILTVAEVTNTFCGLVCFFRHLAKVYDTLIVRDYSLYHEPKEKSERKIGKKVAEEVAFQLARIRR